MSDAAAKPGEAVGDARGAHSRRPDAASIVARSGLPAELSELVLGVTSKVLLWRTEQADVARELCGHFADGLEAGRTSAQLRESFGEPAHAAKLIRSAKRRSRPWWWHAQRRAWMSLLLVLALAVTIYGVLAIRFFTASPTIKHNFIGELNATVAASSPDDRAWPLYVQAIREFGKTPEFMMQADYGEPKGPGQKDWDTLAAWLTEHQHAMDTVRRAAKRPVLGYQYRSSMDPDLGKAMETLGDGYQYVPEQNTEPENPLVVGVLLPHLGYMRTFARRLQADAGLAVSLGDGARFEADIDAMLGMAEQALSERFIISQLVGIAVCSLTLDTVMDALNSPGAFDLLDGPRLTALAHRLAGFAGDRVRIDAAQERVFVEDVLQRFYTDDGRGDGYMVGSAETDRIYADFGISRPKGYFLMAALGPVRSALLSSRKTVNAHADAFVAAAGADDLLPPWRHDERTSDARWRELMESGIYAVVPIIESLQGGTEQGPMITALAARDLFEAHRDAALTILALEASLRRTGAYPATLVELVPALLPRVPLDPFDGKPLRYLPPKSAADRPVLYSVGVDGVDEGGKAPTTKAGQFGVHNLYWQTRFRRPEGLSDADLRARDKVRGDWVMWPNPPAPPEPVEKE